MKLRTLSRRCIPRGTGGRVKKPLASAIVVNDTALKILVESHLEFMVKTYNNEGYKWRTKALELANRVSDTSRKMMVKSAIGKGTRFKLQIPI
ncbi:MAG: hypothetical protein AAFX55_17625 [Bacteroidota bacterium]